MFKKNVSPLVAAAALLFASAASNAAITVYTTQASFLAAVGAPATDTFDTLSTGFSSGITARSVGSYAYSATATRGLFASATGLDVVLSSNGPTDALTFSGFTGGVGAIGGLFFNTDFAGALASGQGITLTATDASGAISRTIAQPVANSFLGFVSTGSLTSLSVVAGQDAANSYFPTVNNLVLAAAVPEPETYSLFLAGIGLLAVAMRRRSGAR